MPRALRAASLCILAVSVAAGVASAADELPTWAKEAAALTVPKYPVQVRTVELLHEEAVTVAADGSRIMRERGVVKVLQPNAGVSAYRTYNTKSGRIRDFNGWEVSTQGKVTAAPKNRVLDVAIGESQVYEEARAKVLEFAGPTPGAVYAYEIVEEEKTVFTQYALELQDRSPRLISRFSLTVPAGWEVRGTVFNRDELKPTTTGSSYTWELRDLPRIEAEDYAPPLSSVAPFLAVSYFPPEANPSGLRGLKDWTAVSNWLSPMVDPQAAATDKVRAKALELTAKASTEIDKLRAIAKFVQQTNYVSVDLNITRGGGYTPHRPDDVLTKNYGDCKDKATLTRALLKAIGIESYLTVISADDPNFVRPEWASPMQFNHAIVAIVAADAVQAPAVLEKTPLGRLLMFDPTDPITPLGDLPEDEQGSHALVIASGKGELLEMPRLAAEASRIESVVQGTVDPTGLLHATLDRRYYGQSGVFLRSLERYQGAPELKKRLERAFSRRIPGATLPAVSTQALENDALSVKVELAADRFAQIQRGLLFIIRPGYLTSGGGEYSFSGDERKGPVQLNADLRRDSIRLRIPAGFKLDELPEAAKFESPYGKIETKWTVANGEIVMEETLEIRQTIAPASEYAKIRDFFEKVTGSHGAPVVLVKE